MIKFVKDKDPIWDTDEFDVILIGTSVYNWMSGGFQSKIRFKYPIVEEENKKTRFGDMSKLGTRITIYNKPIVSLMYMCGTNGTKNDTVDYDGLTKCLQTANAEFKGKKCMCTIIGSTQFDGRGDREKCLQILEENTKDLDITVYDYEQKPRIQEIKEQRKYLASLRVSDQEKYEQLKSVFDLYLKKLYLNG